MKVTKQPSLAQNYPDGRASELNITKTWSRDLQRNQEMSLEKQILKNHEYPHAFNFYLFTFNIFVGV